MNFLEITEPILENTKHGDCAIGIDFGTTNSLACVMNGDDLTILVDITPSIVSFDENGNATIGKAVEGNINISSIKRLIGSGGTITVGNQKLYPEQIAREIFRHLKIESEKALDRSITKAVITVPAYFEEPQRQAIKFAAELAGFDVLRLISEPTAAACFYGIDDQSEGKYAVFDLGGGTFDVSILTMQKGVIKISASGGDAKLGGDDFDTILAKHLNISKLEAKAIKESLTDRDHKLISRDQFDALVLPLVHKMVDVLKQTLNLAVGHEIEGIILVGGSTRMPIIKEALRVEFQAKIFDDLDPDRIVAYGAALQARNIVSGTGNLLLDVIPLSLGIETAGGAFEKIIERNSNIPISKSSRFTTSKDGQSGIVIHVLQGERDIAINCRSLAKFELSNIPQMPAGLPKIDVQFTIDENGILSVSAKEETSGIEQNINVKPTYGISSDDIHDMLIDAISNAQDDIETKFLVDTKIDARAMMHSLEVLLKQNTLENTEKGGIDEAMNALTVAVEGDDRKAIELAMENLDKAASGFAERVAEESLKSVFSGKNVMEIPS